MDEEKLLKKVAMFAFEGTMVGAVVGVMGYFDRNMSAKGALIQAGMAGGITTTLNGVMELATKDTDYHKLLTNHLLNAGVNATVYTVIAQLLEVDQRSIISTFMTSSIANLAGRDIPNLGKEGAQALIDGYEKKA